MTIMPIGWINENTGKGWTDREEEIIRSISFNEDVSRIDAIRRMRHRGLDDLQGAIRPTPEPKTGCLKCGKSLAHLRRGARYCGDTCKKWAQRWSNHEN